MGLREDILDMKKEVNNMKQQSMAMEMLSDYKRQNKKQFIVIILMILLWFITMVYLIYVLTNDTKELDSSNAYAYTQIQTIEKLSFV